MSITSERAAEVLGMAVTFNGCGRSTSDEMREAVSAAIAALREKAEREDHKPLTLEELRQMDGKPVYIVSSSRTGSGWVIFDCHNDDGFGICDETWYFAKSYGKAWIAYRHKPKEVTK